jgi:hypothetical protein
MKRCLLISLSGLLTASTWAATNLPPLTASELLDKFAATQEQITSFIAKGEESMTGSSAQSQTNQVAEQAKADSPKDVSEFLGLDQGRTEKELQQVIANRGLRNICTEDRQQKTYHVYRSDGENISVIFTNGVYSDVRRRSRNAAYADKLFNGLGKVARSLQVTLRTGKNTWKAGENLALEADVRNTGPEEVGVFLNGFDGWAVEMDEQWYHPEGSTTGHARMLAPGEQSTNISIPPAWLLDKAKWRAKPDTRPGPPTGSPLELVAGRHTIRVGVYPVLDSGPDNLTLTNSSGQTIRMAIPEQMTPGKPERAESNAIEIEVVP